MPVANHLHLLFALARERYRGPGGALRAGAAREPPRTLTRDWRELADELEQGVAHPREGLDEALRAQLSWRSTRRGQAGGASVKRLRGLAQRLWPHLRSALRW